MMVIGVGKRHLVVEIHRVINSQHHPRMTASPLTEHKYLVNNVLSEIK